MTFSPVTKLVRQGRAGTGLELLAERARLDQRVGAVEDVERDPLPAEVLVADVRHGHRARSRGRTPRPAASSCQFRRALMSALDDLAHLDVEHADLLLLAARQATVACSPTPSSLPGSVSSTPSGTGRYGEGSLPGVASPPLAADVRVLRGAARRRAGPGRAIAVALQAASDQWPPRARRPRARPASAPAQQPTRRSAKYDVTWSRAIRSCFMVSRSRMVTAWSSRVSKSTVTQYGVPTSSWRR